MADRVAGFAQRDQQVIVGVDTPDAVSDHGADLDVAAVGESNFHDIGGVCGTGHDHRLSRVRGVRNSAAAGYPWVRWSAAARKGVGSARRGRLISQLLACLGGAR